MNEKKFEAVDKTEMRIVEGGTDTMRLLARVAHEQAQNSAADLEDVADQQQSSLIMGTNIQSNGLSFNRCEKLSTGEGRHLQVVDEAELRNIDGGNGSDAIVGSSQIAVMPVTGMTLGQNYTDDVEDNQQTIQFKIQLPTGEIR